MNFAYICESGPEDREAVVLGTAVKAGVTIDEWMLESGDQHKLPYRQAAYSACSRNDS
jgi:hypothetical protein